MVHVVLAVPRGKDLVDLVQLQLEVSTRVTPTTILIILSLVVSLCPGLAIVERPFVLEA